MGISSSLPASISNINTYLENVPYTLKFFVGPTCSSPGPMLLIVAATAVKFDVISFPSKEISSTDVVNRMINVIKYTFTARTTSCSTGLAVHFDLLDTLWMQIGIQLFYHTFYHDDKSGYLDTTTGTACTCTNEHQNNQYRPTCLVPQVKIHTGESGCCYDRSDLERCMTEYCPESIHCMNQIQSQELRSLPQ